MLRTLRWSFIALVVVVVLGVTVYVLGRAQCPPPGWWVALFTDGNYACVA